MTQAIATRRIRTALLKRPHGFVHGLTSGDAIMRSITLKAGLATLILSATLAGASAAPAFSLVQSEQQKIRGAVDNGYAISTTMPRGPAMASSRIRSLDEHEVRILHGGLDRHYPAAAQNMTGAKKVKHYTPLQHEAWLNES